MKHQEKMFPYIFNVEFSEAYLLLTFKRFISCVFLKGWANINRSNQNNFSKLMHTL